MVESFRWKKAKTFQRKVKFFPSHLFILHMLQNLRSVLLNDRRKQQQDQRPQANLCQLFRGAGERWGGGSGMHDAQGQERRSEREWEDRREKPVPGSPPQSPCWSTLSGSAPPDGWLRSAQLCSVSDHRREPRDPCTLATAEKERKKNTSLDLLGQTSVQSWNKLCLLAAEGNLPDLSWLYRGSLLEVPYRNRKSRAAKLNWEFISTDHICSTCKSRVLGDPRSSVWIRRHTAPGLRGLWLAINPWAFIHTPASSSECGPQPGN